MKKYLINGALILVIFLLPIVALAVSNIIEEFVFRRALNISSDWGLLLSYVIIFGVSALSYSVFLKRLGFAGVTIPLVLFYVIFIVFFFYINTVKFTIKLAPLYLTMFLGIAGGYYFVKSKTKRFRYPSLLLIFPLIMSMGLNELWVHKIEYGNFYGSVTDQKIIQFEMTDKEGALISNESLKDNYVLLDFWFISCAPCWVKFPDLQRMYEKYHSQENVKIYAVNRPMKRDKPREMFTAIEEKDYRFPVLAGSQQIMDDFGVYVYPTVVILGKKGEMLFMGELEKAEEMLDKLLAPE
jgi:thiol-disulfide isomerase/thioredoxin